jgi:UDP-glucose 4-epimerase
MRKRVVVTGGAGFIGSHTVDRLLELGCEVSVIDNLSGGNPENLDHHKDNPLMSFAKADIRDMESIKSIIGGASAVIHFAGLGDIVPSINSPLEYLDVNVQGTINVLECCRLSGVNRMVYAASSSCYGLASTPTHETAPIDTRYPYSLSKYMGELAVLHWRRVYGLENISLRIFNAYGPRSRTSGAYGAVIGVFMAQKLADEPLTIVGDGNQRRDFVFVTDVADAFVKAAFAKKVQNPIMNLGKGESHSVMELADLLGGPRTHIPERPGEPFETLASIDRIQEELQWKAIVSFREGIEKVLGHSSYWKNAPVWTPEKIRDETFEWFNYLGKSKDNLNEK